MESRFSPSRGLQSTLKRKNRGQNTEASYVHTNPERNAIRCSSRDQVFLSEAFFLLTSSLLLQTLGRQNQQDTQCESASPPSPPVTAPIHTVDIWFLDLSVAAEMQTSSIRGRSQVCEQVLSTWWRRIKAGGCAAWCTPSCCCSHSVVFAELCVIPFTYSLRIFFLYGPRCFL